jgi:hypothetical protein
MHWKSADRELGVANLCESAEHKYGRRLTSFFGRTGRQWLLAQSMKYHQYLSQKQPINKNQRSLFRGVAVSKHLAWKLRHKDVSGTGFSYAHPSALVVLDA